MEISHAASLGTWQPAAMAAWWRMLHNTEKLADPKGFEPSTSAFGGHLTLIS
jgi:hypothetical protein